MIKTAIILVTILLTLTVAAGGYYYFLYPPVVMERVAQRALNDFSAAVATKDRTKVSEALQRFLLDSASIRLEVTLMVIGANNASPAVQDFNKSNFITFIDNILYSLNDYGYAPQLQHFKLSDDRNTAKMTFTSKEWGNGMSYYAGAGVNMHFSSETVCEGEIIFEQHTAQLGKAVCKVQLRSTPK